MGRLSSQQLLVVKTMEDWLNHDSRGSSRLFFLSEGRLLSVYVFASQSVN